MWHMYKLKHRGKTMNGIMMFDEKICEIAEKYVPDYDAQKTYQELENSEYKSEE